MKQSNEDLICVGNSTLGIEGFGGCTLSEYHMYLLKILKEIDRICRKNNILYFLMYGSLIGAVRHHGFVPWDDDADIIMTRCNFNRFREVCKNDLGAEFDLVTYYDDDNYNYTFPKIRLKNTTYIMRAEVSRHGRNAGFFIDIMIMDELAKNPFIAHIQKRAAIALHRLVSPCFYQSSIGLNRIEDVLVSVSRVLLGKKRSIQIASTLVMAKNAKKSDFMLAEIFMPTADDFYIYDAYHFKKNEYLPFEDTVLSVPYQPITLLHSCYFKNFKKENILIEYPYPNEAEAIRQGKCYHGNDIMFIPRERKREHHLEIIFDCERESSFYDNYYFTKFDKKENDRFALKERRQRERNRNVLKMMDSNEKTARAACSERLLLEYISRVMNEYPVIDDIPIDKAISISEKIFSIMSIFPKDINIEQYIYILRLFCRCGYYFYAKRMVKCIIALYPNMRKELVPEIKWIDAQEQVSYAIYEQNVNSLTDYLQQGYNDIMSITIKGVQMYFMKQYNEAFNELMVCRNIYMYFFWTNYYLGLIESNRHNLSCARGFFFDALNSTTFMPLIQLAMNKIKAIDNGISE